MSYNHENLIVGCGNILFGDDGFGPKVIEYMKENNVEIPGDTCLIDGGTSAPHYIFTLPPDKWKNIIIIDIALLNKKPGTIEVLNLNQVKEEDRYMDIHGISATYPLHDLEDRINIQIVGCQPENVPQDMDLELTETLNASIPEAVEITIKLLNKMLK